MIQKILTWFNAETNNQEQSIPPNLAAAVLMVEVMAADDHWKPEEEKSIRQALLQTLRLPDDEVDALISNAKAHHDSSHDLYSMTKRVHDHFSVDDKFQLLLSMWQVAYADGDLDRYEDYTIRKISELLYIPHDQFIRAKLQAKPE